MNNVAVVVEDRPSSELLKEMEIIPPDTLYGLYQGTPLPEREWAHGNALPDRITIYQQPIVDHRPIDLGPVSWVDNPVPSHRMAIFRIF